MSISELLKKLEDAEVKVALNGDNLKLLASKSNLTKEVVDLLKNNKQMLIEHLKRKIIFKTALPDKTIVKFDEEEMNLLAEFFKLLSTWDQQSQKGLRK